MGKAYTQSQHRAINAREYPGTRQLCCICDEPTGRCEEDGIWWPGLDGWVCPECDNHFTHLWGYRKWLGQYYGQPCKLHKTGPMNVALIEFPDGVKHITLRMGLRGLDWEPKN